MDTYLYLQYREEMLSLLNGIFAFAIWDSRSQSLFIARDALGVKPLYYHTDQNRMAFASEIKALSFLVKANYCIDQVALDRYLSFLWSPGGDTPVKEIKKLKPGEAMIVKEGQISQRWQWYRLPQFCKDTVRIKSSKQVVDDLTKYLRTAVQSQMVSDVPVGAFLSGGLDSSAIVAMAKKIDPSIRCYTIESSGGQEPGLTDDLPYAKRVAQHLQVPLEVVSIDADRMAHDLEMMVYQLDEPLSDPAPLNVLYISRLAREQGIKVLLSGAGGDDLFTGYRRHYALQLERYWKWLPYTIRQALCQVSAGLDQRNAFSRRLAKFFSGAKLQGDERLINYFRWAKRSDLHKLYSPDFRAILTDHSAEQPMLDFLAELPSSVEGLDRMLALEQRFFLTDHNLTYTDKMSMAAGVEVRVPFLDLDMVEFANRIPLKFKQRGRHGKWVLKKAMEPFLPYDVIYRPKSGFGAPLRRWMRYELRELLGDMLSEESLNRRGLFDAVAVQRLIADNTMGKVDASYTLFSLLCIEIWCRAYIDGLANGMSYEK